MWLVKEGNGVGVFINRVAWHGLLFEVVAVNVMELLDSVYFSE